MGHGRGGVFWQTQASGKSFSMVFFAQKGLRTLPGNWTFMVVTDRVELDEQIAKTFKATGAVGDAADSHASSGAHLRELLAGNPRYVFTLVHKFQSAEVLCDRSDVIVLTDEAHRSQYDTLALNMRAALPRATFLAFTGTPLIAGEERTREVFGDYVSVYDFQQSIEDGATVPLFYENRTPELQLVNADLNDEIYELIENAALNPDQEARLERELGRQYHLITRDDRLEAVARDIVRHFLDRGFFGKAMVVSIDKATALRMHDKVRQHWADETKRVQTELGELALLPLGDERSAEQARRDVRKAELTRRLDALNTTDMAVIVSPGQNEIAQMAALGLDIEPHRKRMNDSQPGLDEKFKDTTDPLRLVFVCAMWLTGFDAPSCSTVYLDKPMRNHTLMQTIARANRVFPGKHSGVIVDYANVFASLEKALAIYGKGGGSANPVRDKAELAQALARAVEDACAYCANKGVDLAGIEALANRFHHSRQKKTDLEVLKATVRARLETMIEANHLRADFAEKFEALIESYNAGSRSIESLFLELVKLSKSLGEEAQRHVRENLSEDELVVFDILTRPSPELSAEERAEVKKVARDLLARSQIKLAIEDVLDGGLPRVYTPELYHQKCAAVFEHGYERYPQGGKANGWAVMALARVPTHRKLNTATPQKAQPTSRGAPSCSSDSPTTAGGAMKMKAVGRSRSGQLSATARRTSTNAATSGQKTSPTPNCAAAQAS